MRTYAPGIIWGGARPLLVHFKRLLCDARYREFQRLCSRFGGYPRYKPFQARLHGSNIVGPDAPSFLSAVYEIIVEESYDFAISRRDGLILDCGGNIGVSTFFFLNRFPEARIKVFEADPVVFEYLSRNLRCWTENRRDRVEFAQLAVYTDDKGVFFATEGADAGRISCERQAVRVPSVRLKDLLSEPVEFLKLDVEGAEFDILSDCAMHLRNVRYCFVELHCSASEETGRIGEALSILEAAGFKLHMNVPDPLRRPFRAGFSDGPFNLLVNVFGARTRLHS